MKPNLLISIIIPTLNQGKFIEKAIRSIIEQDHADFEIIIIDGGSTDNTLDVINKYSTNIKYWESKKDQGQSHAINKGFGYASGEIINWLNSDDYLEKGALKTIAENFLNHDIDFLFGYSNFIGSNQQKYISKRTSELKKPWESSIANSHYVQPSSFFRKNVFKRFGPLNETLNFMMDHYFWLKYLCASGTLKTKYIDAVLSNICVHPDAKSVKLIMGFKDDKDRIWYSFMKKNNYSTRLCKKTEDHLILDFPAKPCFFEDIRFEKLDFYLLLNRLFKCDQNGRKRGVDLKVFVKLLFFFPVKTVKEILKKTLS